ncbi:hypothetical protein R3P38DRAFT_2757685 [Favolaschia claudopus]|uniref:Uncharacterized protein n=1 Tax=Favolaschia claudopus TaxID=2862362 RepID=A0AAW0ELD7_9AGAR
MTVFVCWNVKGAVRVPVDHYSNSGTSIPVNTINIVRTCRQENDEFKSSSNTSPRTSEHPNIGNTNKIPTIRDRRQRRRSNAFERRTEPERRVQVQVQRMAEREEAFRFSVQGKVPRT